MKTLLRLTRHSVLAPQAAPGAYPEDVVAQTASAQRQLAEIHRIWGDDVVILEVPGFTAGTDPVTDVKAAIEAAGVTVDAVEVVLPPNLLMPLTNPRAGLPAIVRAEMNYAARRPEGEPVAPPTFKKYVRVVKVEVVTEDL